MVFLKNELLSDAIKRLNNDYKKNKSKKKNIINSHTVDSNITNTQHTHESYASSDVNNKAICSDITAYAKTKNSKEICGCCNETTELLKTIPNDKNSTMLIKIMSNMEKRIENLEKNNISAS